MLDWSIILAAASGLILFLYGMEQFSREIQKAAGESFRAFLKRATKSTPRAVILGCFVTAIIQSSTAVTLITLGLVESGILSFSQSLGIILGAGIGTTITAQLVAFNFTALGPVFILLGFIIGLFGGRFPVIGKAIFYFGLVFFGISMVSIAAAPLQEDPGIVSLISNLSSVPLAIITGFIITNLFQSSSLFTGLVVMFASSGLLTIDMAIPLVLGSNIGTMSPLLASANMGLFAKRASVAQLLFNLGGVLIILPFLPHFTYFIISLGGTTAQQAANAHTLFNIITTVVFLIVLKPVERFVIRVVPGKEEEILFHTEALNDQLPENNSEAFKQIETELAHLMLHTSKVLEESANMFPRPDKNTFNRLRKREALNDFIDEKIEKATLELTMRELEEKETARTVLLIRMSNDLEQLADIGVSLGYVANSIVNRGRLSDDALAELDTLYKEIEVDLRLIRKKFPRISDDDVASMRQNEISMRESINAVYSRHLKRLKGRTPYAAGAFVKVIARLEAAHAKLREIRKLCEMYGRL
ncbi:MAG: Na/Pi cotransporter family protein [Candidatus ainarchaeum sp.]|nr:Na/Pi cotransporter family protein [Candidatus ainarchaeum sp.]